MAQQATYNPPSRVLCTLALALGVFMQVLDTTIANVSLPTIAGNLGVSSNQGTWVITSFTVCNAIGLPITAWLSRRVGEVRLYLGALLLFSLTSFLCGISDSMAMLVGFRTLQGLSAAPLYPMGQTLLLSIFPAAKRGSALALLGMVAVVGPIVGPILGGWLTYDYSWPWIFFINVPIGIFAAVVIFAQMKNRPLQVVRAPLDYVGLIALILGVGVLQLILDKGNELDWFSNRWILAGAVFSVIAIAFLIIWELTEKHPIINLTLFRNRNFAFGTLALVMGYSGFFGINLILPQWLQSQLGYTSTWAGLAAAPLGVLPLLLSPIIGRFAPQLDMRKLAAMAFMFMSASCYMRMHFNLEVDFKTVALVQLFMGAGIALFFMPTTTILLSDLSGEQIADASALSTFLRTLGGSFASSLTTWLWDRRAIFHHAQLTEHVTSTNYAAQNYLNALSGDETSRLMQLNEVITQQGFMMSTVDYFYLMMWVFAAMIAIVFLTKRARPVEVKGSSGAGAGAH
ncbi:DHA2 family efflux MFS transporter permease subunit [Phytohalomonas tamaricis]|uniref:DHA2 family efflux MFS transporter permease subunit n=1 Tax=Phytohalomonas tamaricis TaxID=2081032 RepID=UPI000D0B83BA|nr:DHA2 family efflux MFS transporter permease subunit [Phytohalomonas tamaricis]